MRVDRKLNLVMPLDRENHKIYVHSTPVMREVFETYYRPMSVAHSQLFKLGIDWVTGPRVAHLMLRDAAKTLGQWEGDAGVERGLFPEIRRLTWVIAPAAAGGWATVPFDAALAQDMLSEGEASEAMGAICFFILVSALTTTRMVPTFLSQMGGLYRTQTTLLNSTEFANSLPTSTETDSSDPKAPESLATS